MLSSLLFPKSQPAKITASWFPGSTASLQSQPGQTCLPIYSSRTLLAPAAALQEVWDELPEVFISQPHGRAGLSLTRSSAVTPGELPALHPTLTSLPVLGVAQAALQGWGGLRWRTGSVTSCSGAQLSLVPKGNPLWGSASWGQQCPLPWLLGNPCPSLSMPRTVGL